MLNLQSLISMGVQAMQLMGKKGNILVIASKAAQVWNEYQKYPRTPEGLKQAMRAHNLDATSVREALSSLNPQLRTFIDKQLPGSLDLLSNMVNEAPKKSTDIQGLVQKAKRR